MERIGENNGEKPEKEIVSEERNGEKMPKAKRILTEKQRETVLANLAKGRLKRTEKKQMEKQPEKEEEIDREEMIQIQRAHKNNKRREPRIVYVSSDESEAEDPPIIYKKKPRYIPPPPVLARAPPSRAPPSNQPTPEMVRLRAQKRLFGY